MSKITYCITYDLVTEESAERGDFAERGYIVDGQELPIPEDLVGDAAKRWREEQGVDTEIDVEGSWYGEEDDPFALERCCAEIVRQHYCTEASSTGPLHAGDWFVWYDSDSGAITSDGVEATRCGGVHFKGLTDEQMRRVEWFALKARHISEPLPINLV